MFFPIHTWVSARYLPCGHCKLTSEHDRRPLTSLPWPPLFFGAWIMLTSASLYTHTKEIKGRVPFNPVQLGYHHPVQLDFLVLFATCLYHSTLSYGQCPSECQGPSCASPFSQGDSAAMLLHWSGARWSFPGSLEPS